MTRTLASPKTELTGLLALGLPIILTQLMQIGNNTVAIVMMGRVGSREMAAIGLGGAFMIFVYLLCLGIMTSLSPTIAQHFGAGRERDIRRFFQQGLWMALGVSVMAFFLLREMGRVMLWMSVDPEVVPLVQDYLDIVSWSMPAVCYYLALRFVCEGIGHSQPMMMVSLLTLPVALVGNWALIFGHLGFPALGVRGAAWNLVLVMVLNTLGLLLYLALSRRYRSRHLFASFALPGAEIWALLKLGLPIAGTLVLDSGFFSMIALLMGQLGHVALAAHQAAINYVTVVFMIPVGLSSATMARVGQSIGRGDQRQARRRGLLGIGVGVTLVLPSVLLALLLPGSIVALYTHDASVTLVAVTLLTVAGLFQLFDAVFITAQGALRGLKDVTGPLWISLLCYWLCGLPIAWFLGIQQGLGPIGLWYGMALGLGLTALLLGLRFHTKSARLVTEHAKAA
tara:strand:+ start:569 stop:1930 length:1362 start_codon:yes stop_codon:yes gene_type:complete